jgi:hypothetical protein
MKKALILLTLLACAGSAVYAVPTPCSDVVDIDDILALGIDGCFEGDKIFDLWSTNLPGATPVTISSSGNSYSVNYGPVGPFNTGPLLFTLQYHIFIDPTVAATTNITLVSLDLDGTSPGVQSDVTKTFWSDDFDGAVVGTLNSTGALQNQAVSVKELWVRDSLVLREHATHSATNGFDQTTAIPEPATYMMIGSGLVALGFLQRWRSRRRA